MESLMKFMRINRGLYFHKIVPPATPQDPPVGPDPLPIESYNISDFGENVINNHFTEHGGHSEKCQTIFNYVTRDFRSRCTSFQTYNTEALYNGFLWRGNYLTKCAQLHADLVFTPYVNAAYSSEGEYYDFVLPVASHRDNSGLRYDITAGAGIFLTNTVAVAARRDTPSTFKLGTSYGFGVEFFEDCSPEALDSFYPDSDVPTAFAELLTDDGINLYSTVHPTFSQYLKPGELITIRYSGDSAQWIKRAVSEIVGPDHIRITSPVPIIQNGGIYGWKDVTLGEFIGGQAQSWAVPLVAGKLKVIKMTTGADWDTVRAAARATAKRNHTGIPEIDEASWDIYRGFGCIQVDDAIQYINNL